MNVILASASPRRKELLGMLYNDFSVAPADIDENIDSDIVYEAAEIIAIKKAQAITIADSLIIACDTVVIYGGEILGKPENKNHAELMLALLSGKVHHVMTGVCLKYNDKSYSFTEKTAVEFYPLTEADIDNYINTSEPFDKAGSYGIQGQGAFFVKRIDGDYYNVVGLPLPRLKKEIERFKMIYGL